MERKVHGRADRLWRTCDESQCSLVRGDTAEVLGRALCVVLEEEAGEECLGNRQVDSRRDFIACLRIVDRNGRCRIVRRVTRRTGGCELVCSAFVN